MSDIQLPNWYQFKELAFFYSDEEEGFLKAIHENLDNKTWEWALNKYNTETGFLEAIGRFAYTYVKFQKKNKSLFDPVMWFKLQHRLANELKIAYEKKDLERGLNLIAKFENKYESKVVFNTHFNEDYYYIISRDFCDILEDFDRAWEFQKGLKNKQRPPNLWRYLKHTAPKPLNADIILACYGMNYLGLTDYGKENLSSVKIVVDGLLKDYFDEFGNNPIYEIVNKYREPLLNGKKFNKLKKYFILDEDFEHWKNNTLNYCVKMNQEREMKTGFPLLHEPWFKSVGLYVSSHNDYFPNILHKALSNYFDLMFRKAENEVRVNKGVPKIGEGWVSETELYYELKEKFSDLKIIQHATPKWLNGQHFDIYFPDENIAIEYHGKQHFEPVEFFGGVEGFEHQKERDQRKARLAKENDCNLLIVKKGYELDNIVSGIKKILSKS